MENSNVTGMKGRAALRSRLPVRARLPLPVFGKTRTLHRVAVFVLLYLCLNIEPSLFDHVQDLAGKIRTGVLTQQNPDLNRVLDAAPR
jgi:hypothetical protein